MLINVDPHRERLLQCVAEMEILPKLKRIELRGLYVREEELLALNQRTGIQRLFIYNVFLSSGTLRSVFDYCTSDNAGMENIYFEKLIEQELGCTSIGLETRSFRSWLLQVVVKHQRGQALK